MPKFGLLCYPDCYNIGDEIQSIAASRFLPHIDEYFDRDDLASVPSFQHSDEKWSLILNGWFKRKSGQWPPADHIDPLFIAFHAAKPALVDARHADYYRRHGPIGCRDLATMYALQQIGVDAYLTGCLTLTLERPDAPRDGSVYIVDVPADLQRYIPPAIRRTARRITHGVHLPKILRRLLARLPTPWLQRYKFRRARHALDRYARAGLVITSRLHCALPCIAFGTPVVVLRLSRPDKRWLGTSQELIVHTEHTAADIDWADVTPYPRPDTTELVDRVRRFVAARTPSAA